MPYSFLYKISRKDAGAKFMKNKKLGLFKIFFAALRENQSSLINKTKSRSKRIDFLKNAIITKSCLRVLRRRGVFIYLILLTF